MKHLYLISKKHHVMKVINLKNFDGMGYNNKEKCIYVTFHGIRKTVFECTTYTDDFAYTLCEKILEKYINENMVNDSIYIDIDEIIASIQKASP